MNKSRNVNRNRNISSGAPLTAATLRKRKRRKSFKERFLIFLLVLVILASLAILGYNLFMGFWQGSLSDLNWNPLSSNEKQANFLVLGLKDNLSDINLVVSLDNQGKTLKFLQIPRDSYVGDLAPRTGKMNEIYSNGNLEDGVQRVRDSIKYMFGLEINHYLLFDQEGFCEIIDSLGGVEVDVPIPVSYGKYSISEGKQNLSGKEAEIFIRVRKAYSDSDFGRMRAQRILYEAMFEKLFTMSKFDLAKAAPGLIKNFKSDMSPEKLLSYADIGKKIKKTNIRFFTAGGVSGNHNGGSVIYLNKTETCRLLNSHFRPYSDPLVIDQLNIYGDNLDVTTFKNDDGKIGDATGENQTSSETTP